MASTQCSLSDCMQCGSLCLGPKILPCGHCVCKKCALRVLGGECDTLECPLCDHPIPRSTGESIKDAVNKMATDFVIEELVNSSLAEQQGLRCHSCPEKNAVSICLDCGKYYCDVCKVEHKTHVITKCHDMMSLKTLQLMKSSSQNRNFFSIRAEGELNTLGDDNSPCLDDNDKESLQMERMHFKEQIRKFENAARKVDDAILELQKFKEDLEKKQHLLSVYCSRLSTNGDQLLHKWQKITPRLQKLKTDLSPPDHIVLHQLQHVISRLQSAKEVSGIMGYEQWTRETTAMMGVLNTNLVQCTPTPTTASDTDRPWITQILVTSQGQLIMADCNNSMVKVATVTHPSAIRGVVLHVDPLRLAQLQDGRVAVTAINRFLYLVDVSGQPTILSHCKTVRQYRGVTAGCDDNTLVVGCGRDMRKSPCIDVISLSGDVLRTIANSDDVEGLIDPEYLFMVGDEVLVSDWGSHSVLRVDLATGCLIDTMTHAQLKLPCQVATDSEGSVYIASAERRCVMIRAVGGEWRRFLVGTNDGDGPRDMPIGIFISGKTVWVSWYKLGFEPDCYSVVKGFELT